MHDWKLRTYTMRGCEIDEIAMHAGKTRTFTMRALEAVETAMHDWDNHTISVYCYPLTTYRYRVVPVRIHTRQYRTPI